MKAEELNLGDYVIAGNCPTRVCVLRDGDYHRNIGVMSTYGIVFYLNDEIKPIPLIHELLEKNGWKKAQFWHEYQDGGNTLQAYLPDMRGIFNGVEIQHFKCEYVHQYQHLLRLCGLNDLADNFEIE